MARKATPKPAARKPSGNIVWNEDENDQGAPIATLAARKPAVLGRRKTGRLPHSPYDDAPMGTGRELGDERDAAKAPQAAMTLDQARAMVAQLEAAQTAAGATLRNDGVEPTAMQLQTAGMSAALMKRIVIVLEENDNIPPTGLFIQYNGVPFILRTGVEASVPLPLTEILDNAKTHVAITDATHRIVAYRPKLRFPYTVRRMAA